MSALKKEEERSNELVNLNLLFCRKEGTKESKITTAKYCNFLMCVGSKHTKY